MKELTRQQSRQPIGLQEKAQERSLWPSPVEPEQKQLQYEGKDGSLRSLDNDPNKVNEHTGHRRTGGLTPQRQWLPST